MMHIAILHIPPIYQQIKFSFISAKFIHFHLFPQNLSFLLNLRFLLPHIFHDAFMHHALHVLDTLDHWLKLCSSSPLGLHPPSTHRPSTYLGSIYCLVMGVGKYMWPTSRHHTTHLWLPEKWRSCSDVIRAVYEARFYYESCNHPSLKNRER